MDCRKRCGCRNRNWIVEIVGQRICVPEMDGLRGGAALREVIEPAVRTELKQAEGWLAAGIARLKAAVVEVAAAKGSQPFGREEEKE